jgi:hypothetical protein
LLCAVRRQLRAEAAHTGTVSASRRRGFLLCHAGWSDIPKRWVCRSARASSACDQRQDGRHEAAASARVPEHSFEFSTVNTVQDPAWPGLCEGVGSSRDTVSVFLRRALSPWCGEQDGLGGKFPTVGFFAHPGESVGLPGAQRSGKRSVRNNRPDRLTTPSRRRRYSEHARGNTSSVRPARRSL